MTPAEGGDSMRFSVLAVAGLCVSLLTACALGGAMFVKPGATVDLISASQNQVTLEYTHDYDSELPAAGKVADQECSRFGKHAALLRIDPKTIDRSLATFKCE